MGQVLTKNRKIQKFVLSLWIISLFLPTLFIFTTPREVKAAGFVPTDEFTLQGLGWKQWAEVVAKQALMVLAKKFLSKLTQSTINWINSGFHGAPLFVENPNSFFKDIAKYEVRGLVDLYGYDSRRYPFGRDFALNIIDSYQSQLAENTAYSLSNVIEDPILLEEFRTDFNVGGWNGFLINTQYPQNNYVGFQILANEELARRLADNPVSNNIARVQDTLQKGSGFLSPEKCLTNPNYNNAINQFRRPSYTPLPYDESYWNTANGLRDVSEELYNEAAERARAYDRDYENRDAIAKMGWSARNDCPGGLVSTTPGSVVANQIMGALSSGRVQGELSTAMGSSISAIIDAVLNKFMGDGLNALGNRVNPPPEDTNDFQYFGDSVRTALEKAGQAENASVTPPQAGTTGTTTETGTTSDVNGNNIPPNSNYPSNPGVCATDEAIQMFLSINNFVQPEQLPQVFPCN